MPEGIFITKVEWNQLMKKISSIEERLVNASKPAILRKWISEAEAMELIKCKKTKLKELRSDRVIEFKYASTDKRGYGKGLLISRSSVEAYNEANTREGIYKTPLKKAI